MGIDNSGLSGANQGNLRKLRQSALEHAIGPDCRDALVFCAKQRTKTKTNPIPAGACDDGGHIPDTLDALRQTNPISDRPKSV